MEDLSMRRPARFLAVAVAAATLLAVPAVASAHVELISSSPQAGDNLDTAPTDVTVTFDDELDPDLSSFTVTDENGDKVGDGEVDLTVADRNVMTGSVSIANAGVYTVAYTVGGVDGHVLEGTYSFGFNALQQIPEPTGGEKGPDTAMPVPQTPLAQLVGSVLLGLAAVILVRRRILGSHGTARPPRTGRRFSRVSRMSHAYRRAGGSILIALLCLLAACVPSTTLPATCHDPSVTFAATLTAERLEPATFDVCRDQQVTITFTIQRDGILHVHGYDDQLAATPVQAGQTIDFSFEAVRVGQFPIAVHPADGSAETDVGTLVVNEP
jgi:methionine-rich copper-binding protein CopC